MSDTKPDAPPLVEILKRLAMHRDGLYESGYGPVRLCNQLSSLDREFRSRAREEDPPRELFLRGDRYHPQPEGYGIVAECVLAAAREHGWLPAPR